MRRPTDHELDLSVAAMLRFGVTFAAIFVFLGGLVYLQHPWAKVPDYTHFAPGSDATRTLPGIFLGLIHTKPRSIIQFGLLLLIATPVARVAFCVVGFFRQRNYLYVVVSSIVLFVLIYSLTKGVR